jgi:hypothetical protein
MEKLSFLKGAVSRDFEGLSYVNLKLGWWQSQCYMDYYPQAREKLKIRESSGINNAPVLENIAAGSVIAKI